MSPLAREQVRDVDARHYQKHGDRGEQHEEHRAGRGVDMGNRHRIHAEVPAPLERQFFLEPGRNLVGDSLRVGRGDARIESADPEEAQSGICRAPRLYVQRNPERLLGIHQAHTGRQHADDRVGLVVEGETCAERRRIGAEPADPERVAEHDDVLAARQAVTLGKPAADARLDAEHVEQANRCHECRHSFGSRIPLWREFERHRRIRLESLEERALLLPAADLLREEVVASTTAGPAQVDDVDEAVAVKKRWIAEDSLIDDCEDGGRDTETYRERGDHEYRRRRLAGTASHGMAHVLPEAGEQLRPTSLLDPGTDTQQLALGADPIAELARCLRPCGGLGQPTRAQFAHTSFDVIADFRVDVVG